MSGLLELADRVEAAAGADRELDAEIAVAVRYFPSGVGFVWQDSLNANSPEIGRVECCTKLGTGGPHYKAPAYSASLDAALTLVPAGLMWTMDSWSKTQWSAGIWRHQKGWLINSGIDHQAQSPALALVAASLRARHALTEGTSNE